MKISVKQYARALFETSQDDNNLEKIIINLNEVIDQKNAFFDYLQNTNKSKKDKYDHLTRLGLEKNSINFLLLLVENGDFDKLEIIFLYLKEMQNVKNNTLEVKVETAHELDESEKNYIINKIKEKTAKNVLFSQEVNSEILGGMIIKIGDTIIDNSLNYKLEILKQDLIN